MGAAAQISGYTFQGRRKAKSGSPISWHVKERLTDKDDLTPGQFSIGYRVESSDGREAFMKVSDLSLLTGDGEILDRIVAASHAHKFERDILDYCHGSNMDRVVTAIDYGDSQIKIDGEPDVLFFLIFELARGDLRRQIRQSEKSSFLWILGALHHLATAIQQLHGGGVCHNDIKPANFLVFDENLQKLADLGRATSNTHLAAHNDNYNVGDPTYAAPEIIYAESDAFKNLLCKTSARRASDLYQLGSVAWFMVTGRMLTPEIIDRLDAAHLPEHKAGGWNGRFLDIIPYWREAVGRAFAESFDPCLEALTGSKDSNLFKSFREMVLQLTECDPAIRGHPLNRQGHHEQFSVERYIAGFDLLKRDVLVRP